MRGVLCEACRARRAVQGVLCEAYRAGAVRMAGKTMVKWQDMLLRMEELDALDSIWERVEKQESP